MPVYKDKKRNTWYVSYTYKINKEYRKKVKRGFNTKHEASLWESKQRVEDIKTCPFTIKEIFDLLCKSNDTSPNTKLHKERQLHLHFPYFKMPIAKVSKEDLLNWRNDLKDSNLSIRTINLNISYVKSIYKFANNVYSVPNNALVINYYKAKNKKEMQVWTIEEFRQFISCVNNPVYNAFFSFLFWTGCRRGEAIALTKDDIKGNIVSINKSISKAKDGVKSPKTTNSVREIQIDKELLNQLKMLVKMANPYIFGGEHHLSLTTIDRYFDKAIKDSGVKRIRLHDLRHSHATILINNNVNIVAVSKRLGHSNTRQTLTTYTHLLTSTNDEMINKIEKIVSNSYHEI